MAIFPVELFAPVRFWANYVYTDIVHWSHQSRGGHFAAMEEPLLLSQDIWRFVRTVNAESRKKHDL